MKKKICVFFADGVEEIESITVVDMLRRAGAEVTMVSITGRDMVHGAHGIRFLTDRRFEEIPGTEFDSQDMLVLPGGMPGTLALGEHDGLKALLRKFDSEGKYIAAICAAPSVLGRLGLLNGKRATSYPGFEDALKGAEYTCEAAVTSGNIITSRGAGTAIYFALEIIGQLFGQKKRLEAADSIVYII